MTKFHELLLKNAYDIFRTSMIANVYKSEKLFDQMMAKPGVRQKFDQIISDIYDKKQFDLREFDKFEQLSGNKHLQYFLQAYRYCHDMSKHNLEGPNGEYYKDNESQFLSELNDNCKYLLDAAMPDFINGNRWWEQDTVSALRMQLLRETKLFPPKKVIYLLKKYLKRDVDYDKEFDGVGREYNNDLLNELDAVMLKQGYAPVYIWKEKVNGETKTFRDTNPPQKNVYYKIEYQQIKEQGKEQ